MKLVENLPHKWLVCRDVWNFWRERERVCVCMYVETLYVGDRVCAYLSVSELECVCLWHTTNTKISCVLVKLKSHHKIIHQLSENKNFGFIKPKNMTDFSQRSSNWHTIFHKTKFSNMKCCRNETRMVLDQVNGLYKVI